MFILISPEVSSSEMFLVQYYLYLWSLWIRFVQIFDFFCVFVVNLWYLAYSSSSFSQAERGQSYESNRKLCAFLLLLFGIRQIASAIELLVIAKNVSAAKIRQKINIKEKSILLS